MAADRLLLADGSLVLLSDGSYVLLSTTTPDVVPAAITHRAPSKAAAFASAPRAVAFQSASTAAAITADSHALTAQGRYAVTFSSPDQSVEGAE